MVQYLIARGQEQEKDLQLKGPKPELNETKRPIRNDGKGWLWNITSTGPLVRRKNNVNR